MASASWSGFHKLPADERMRRLAKATGLKPDQQAILRAPSALPADIAGQFIENAVGVFPVPLGVAVGFVVDGVDVVVPMAVEESSVIAAASHGAKLAAAGGGFATKVDEPVMIAQIELRGITDPAKARRIIAKHRKAWLAALDATVPGMLKRGGGTRGLDLRDVAGRRLVLHLLVDCRDAMGANLVNTLAETLSPWVSDALSAAKIRHTVGLRILSNLSVHRMARATCTVPAAALGGAAAVKAIVEANRFAEVDPFRAATHNKGVLNGNDPVAIATGNDWRAIEAGAHAYAATVGPHYQSLTEWKVGKGGALVGRLELPLAVGTVGGVTKLHPVAKACLAVMGDPDASRLAGIMAAVGLAQNLSALKALAGEGIQRGHMALHASNQALAAGRPR